MRTNVSSRVLVQTLSLVSLMSLVIYVEGRPCQCIPIARQIPLAHWHRVFKRP